jgi:hypothetical protein
LDEASDEAGLTTLVQLMGASDHSTGRAGASRWALASLALVAAVCAACSSTTHTPRDLAAPVRSVQPAPDYTVVCAPLGGDSTSTCLRVTLDAIDRAREREGVGPMVLPANFAQLSVPEQLFVAVNEERVDRGLAPFPGLSSTLDRGAQDAAELAQLPARLGRGYAEVNQEWIGAVDNGLDADYQWMYFDGPGSGVPQCSGSQTTGCWVDRQIVLDRFGSGRLVMGAGWDASGDMSPGDQGGSSLAATLAVTSPGVGGSFTYTWKDALAAMAMGTLQPLHAIPSFESDSGISDPSTNIEPVPDYTRICASSGLDNSSTCVNAVLAAVNHAHMLEGIRPMVLPLDFGHLTVPEQLFVAVNLERVDRGLAPFVGLTATLNRNAQRGADDANDPPDTGRDYALDDAEWAGGSSNGLDAVYGWMYDDGYDSGNLDCIRRDASGCWGHRKGILDDFGSGANLVMGAAVDTTSDTHSGDNGGTSMAVTLAVAEAPVQTFTFRWSQVVATLPASSLST